MFAQDDILRHEERRREVAFLYHMGAIVGMEENVDRTTAKFCETMKTFARSQQQIDMTQWLYFYAFDVIADIAVSGSSQHRHAMKLTSCFQFGKTFGLLDRGRDVSGIMSAVRTFSRYGALVGVYSDWHALIYRLNSMLTTPKAESQGLAYIVEFGRQLIADRVQQGESAKPRGDFISLMYQKHLQDPAAFPMDDVLFHTVPNIGAGADTTAISLNAALYFLCQNPGALKQLREELYARFESKPSNVMISFKEAQECPYLQAVIKETLRLHPAIGLCLPRVVPKEGMMLAGRFFPEGVSIPGPIRSNLLTGIDSYWRQSLRRSRK